MSIELKIKAKHLALEPAIIRKEECKLLKQIIETKRFHQVNDNIGDLIYPFHRKWRELNSHRKWDVRNEARATHLARAYIKGMPYNAVENKRNEEYTFQTYILPRVCSMVAKYGSKKIPKEIWEGSFKDRKKISNPEYEQLCKDIKEWSTI